MITAFIIAAFSLASQVSAPVYELAPITIVADDETPMRTFEVCLHVPGSEAPNACALFECETMVEALHAGREYYGASVGIVTAEVSK